MTSVVEICNQALGHIGVKSITALEEQSETARKCKLYYPMIRNAALRDNGWNFANSYAKLAQLDESVPGWHYVYAIPAKCLNVKKVFNETTINSIPGLNEFESLVAPDSGVSAIATNVSDAWLKYTYEILDPNMFDSKFIEFLSYKLGAALALPLTGNIQMGQGLLQMSANILDKATLLNAREGSIKKNNYSSLIAARS